MTPRHADLAITWTAKDAGSNALLALGGGSRDITRELGDSLLSFSYTDNLTGAADDLSLEVEDRAELWSGDWQPQHGDKVEATITSEPWLTDVKTLRVGTFAHDKITLAGPPARVSIKAISAPLATGLRRTKRTRSWRKATLYDIAADIADRAGVDLDWIGSDGETYKQRVQQNKSDLEFLEELCAEVGRAVKVAESAQRAGRFAIIIFPEAERDSTAPVGEIDLRGGNVLSWSFDADDSARYGSCHIKFFDPRSGKTVEAQYTDPDHVDGQTLEVRLPVDARGQALEICKGKLRQANRFAAAGHLDVVGDPGLVAGVTFDLANAGGLSGRFIITKATHRPVGGYVCSLDVRRCVEAF